MITTQPVAVGEVIRIRLPFSEACAHMLVAGQIRSVRVLDRSAQILNDDGTRSSFPITHGEAGIYRDAAGLFTDPQTEPEE